MKKDIYDIPCIGASAGSLTASLMLTGVDFKKATDFVVEQAEREKLFEKPFGLAGTLFMIFKLYNVCKILIDLCNVCKLLILIKVYGVD